MSLGNHGNAAEELVGLTTNADEANRCRNQFYLMSATFGLNHATVTTPILFASTVLTNAAGQGSNAVLYGTTLICSLFLSNVLFAVIGAKKGLSISMFLYSVYVFLFAVASSLCEDRNSKGVCIEGQPLQAPIAFIGAVVGGFGAGLLWTCQGAFYATVCERLAVSEGKDKAVVTAELAGTWGLIFLGFECVVRASATLLHNYAKLEYSMTFYIFSVLALLATIVFQVFASEMDNKSPKGSLCGKALAAIQLWRDPDLWLLQSTNITFGFAAAWLGGYVGREILGKALSSGFLGFAGALLSGLAALLAKLFGFVAGSIGKGPIVLLGSIAFVCLGVFSRWVGTPASWGWGTLVFYVFMGVGRAVYESTNKAIFADFFPGEKSPGAFANVFVFGTSASTIAFILGAVGNDLPELYLLIVFAALTFPGFLIASFRTSSNATA